MLEIPSLAERDSRRVQNAHLHFSNYDEGDAEHLKAVELFWVLGKGFRLLYITEGNIQKHPTILQHP